MPRKKLSEGPIRRKDGRWAIRVRESNGRLVYTEGWEGFATREDAEYAWQRILAFRQRQLESKVGLRRHPWPDALFRPIEGLEKGRDDAS